MVEWDMHYDDPQAGLRHVMEMNDMFRQVSAIAGKDTLERFHNERRRSRLLMPHFFEPLPAHGQLENALIVFTADHSFQPSIGTHHRAATICKGLPADSANAKPN